MDKSDFIEDVDENLECSVCFSVMVEPRSCSEGHAFCLACITLWLERNQTCPVDRQKLTSRKLTKLRPLENMINALRVRCPQAMECCGKRKRVREAAGCEWTGKLCEKEEHVASECALTLMQCAYAGCPKKMPRTGLATHQEECQYRPVPCQHCAEETPLKNMASHLLVCDEVESDCPNGCGKRGCKFTAKRSEMERHKRDEASFHLYLAEQRITQLSISLAEEQSKREELDSLFAGLSAVQEDREEEETLRPSTTYIESVQHDMDERMREMLLDWLVEISKEENLPLETTFLTQNVVDRFLSAKAVSRDTLQMVGATCMLVVCKHCHRLSESALFWQVPDADRFVFFADHSCTREEILSMEQEVLRTLQWKVQAVTPYSFLPHLGSVLALDNQAYHLACFLAEITIQEYQYLQYKPSTIALSALTLALHALGLQDTKLRLLHKVVGVWGVGRTRVVACCRALHATHCAVCDANSTRLKGSLDKFSLPAWSSVAAILPQEHCPV